MISLPVAASLPSCWSTVCCMPHVRCRPKFRAQHITGDAQSCSAFNEGSLIAGGWSSGTRCTACNKRIIVCRWVDFRNEVLQQEGGRDILFSGRPDNHGIEWISKRITTILQVRCILHQSALVLIVWATQLGAACVTKPCFHMAHDHIVNEIAPTLALKTYHTWHVVKGYNGPFTPCNNRGCVLYACGVFLQQVMGASNGSACMA